MFMHICVFYYIFTCSLNNCKNNLICSFAFGVICYLPIYVMYKAMYDEKECKEFYTESWSTS